MEKQIGVHINTMKELYKRIEDMQADVAVAGTARLGPRSRCCLAHLMLDLAA